MTLKIYVKHLNPRVLQSLRIVVCAVLCLLAQYAATKHAVAAEPAAASGDVLAWPTVSQTARPWTRWWWHGSAVDRENLTRLLETYHAAGLGGVEITCIYGVDGQEDRDIPYLSEQWIDAASHTIREARRLGMGVDLTPGSGWRIGGPSVSDEDADATLVLAREPLRIDQRWAGDPVKRPAPGGEGKSINPYSKRAVTHFLDHFANATDQLPDRGIRAQFHDSFEYDGNWCDDFLVEFAARRGYQLEDHLAALAGKGDPDEVARVKYDYRETLSDLVLERFIEPWVAWSHAHGMLARNQAHGSPANWLDLYAVCDIPETESFGRLVGGDTHGLVFQFASSAAHVAGRPLVSSESATWLDEHFQVTLGQIKEIVDRLFLAGINHVIYHGTAYSPQDAPWPGWLFYASTQLNPQNPIWRDLPALNEYITRCQSILQSTKPDNDIMLYWPIHDVWHDSRGLRKQFQVHNAAGWFLNEPIGRAAKWLEEHGYTFDYVSDRQLAKCRVEDGRIQTPGDVDEISRVASYQVVLVPSARLMPLATLQSLIELAKAGGTVIFLDGLPAGPPGLMHDKQRSEWDATVSRLKFVDQSLPSFQTASIGQGQVVIVRDLAAALPAAGVRREAWSTSPGLQFHRRTSPNGHVYFIKNDSDSAYDGWISPAVDWTAAAIMDPLSGRAGLAAVRDTEAQGKKELRLQLTPGQALFLETFHEPVNAPACSYLEPTGQPIPLVEPWSVDFTSGGPVLPESLTTDRLESWTTFAGAEGQRFSGTARYSTTFDRPDDADRFLLDLGRVADSARVELNGKPVATLIAPPYQAVLEDVPSGENELSVEVTNVAANRIRDLDRRGVKWRNFKDINFVNIKYRPFDASEWPVREAGLLGPVTLTPVATP